MSGSYVEPVYGWTCSQCGVFIPWGVTHLCTPGAPTSTGVPFSASTFVIVMCPHNLDRRRERCLMCEDAKLNERWLRLQEAATELVRLGNQPGLDDDEWEAAFTALEEALRDGH